MLRQCPEQHQELSGLAFFESPLDAFPLLELGLEINISSRFV